MDNTQLIVDKALVLDRAKKHYRRKVVSRTLRIILATIFLTLLSSFGVTTIINSKGGLAVTSNSDNNGKISLSESRDLSNPTTHLTASGINKCDNITYSNILDDFDKINNTDGSHNGDNYFAYTFYLANVGNIPIDVSCEMKVVSNYLGAVEATRIMVIKDEDVSIYAKPRTSDGEKETVPEEVENFASDDVVFNETIVNFQTESIIKFTVVIWLEGYDPECVDNILGGAAQFSINFSILKDQVK